MANIRYFSDFNGSTVELLWSTVTTMDNRDFAQQFPGVKGYRSDGYSKWVGRVAYGEPYLPITRKIEYKSSPSLHECNSKCLNGKHNGVCECRCGGKNHGRGMFSRVLEKEEK